MLAAVASSSSGTPRRSLKRQRPRGVYRGRTPQPASTAAPALADARAWPGQWWLAHTIGQACRTKQANIFHGGLASTASARDGALDVGDPDGDAWTRASTKRRKLDDDEDTWADDEQTLYDGSPAPPHASKLPVKKMIDPDTAMADDDPAAAPRTSCDRTDWDALKALYASIDAPDPDRAGA
jgi:hypothetical protein